jgi:CubicO group peptidase (beta-lactamase class C family)
LPNEEQEGRIIDMHQKQDGKNAVYDMPKGCIFEDFPKEHYLAGAGLLSTLHDYSNFAKMLLNKGEINGKRILSQESVKLLSTPQIPKELMPVPSPGRWGLGVKVIADDTHPTLPKGAYGWSGAYGSHFWVDPENEIYAVFMKNSRFDGGSSNESSINFEKAVYQKL